LKEINRQTSKKPDTNVPLLDLPMLVVCTDRVTREKAEKNWKSSTPPQLDPNQRQGVSPRAVFVDASAMSSNA
jgi:hypothetical protein